MDKPILSGFIIIGHIILERYGWETVKRNIKSTGSALVVESTEQLA